MSAIARPRRALLFCPGDDRRKIEKAAAIGADGAILDLEDAVAPARKDEARRAVAAALAEVEFGRCERLVRINAVGSGLEAADLAALAAAPRPPDAVVVPKVEAADHVWTVSAALEEIETERGLAAGTIRLLAIIETARGVVRLGEIAGADPRLAALVFGAEDLCGDVGAARSREGREIFVARSLVVLHAAAAGLQAIDTPFVDLADEEGLRADARAASDLGYGGKLAIHPRQVAPILAAFTPAEEEIASAERLLAAYAHHVAEGRGVFALDGKMVDRPHLVQAERSLARA